MDVGTLIRLERHTQNMKQAVLAEGICFVSQLSRIENGLIEADKEILEKLIKRLGVAVTKRRVVDGGKLKEYEDRCITIINFRDEQGAAELIKEMIDVSGTADLQSQIQLELLVLQLRLVIEGQEKDVLDELEIRPLFYFS